MLFVKCSFLVQYLQEKKYQISKLDNSIEANQHLIEALSERADQFATNLINLLMSLVLKSILLPILFLYLLLHSVKSIFEMKQ